MRRGVIWAIVVYLVLLASGMPMVTVMLAGIAGYVIVISVKKARDAF
jgi:hypothetical protein